MVDSDEEPRRERRIDAAKAGRRFFVHKTPCRTCHSRLRYTSSNQCVACTKDRAARYQERIREYLADAQ